MTSTKPYRIGLLLFPDITQLDMTGPYEVFTKFPGAEVHLIAKTMEPVDANGGMRIDASGRVVCAQPWARDVVLLGRRLRVLPDERGLGEAEFALGSAPGEALRPGLSVGKQELDHRERRQQRRHNRSNDHQHA